MKIILSIMLMLFHTSELYEYLTLNYKGETVDKVERSEFSLPPFEDSMIDPDKYEQYKQSIEKKVYKSPVDATLDRYGNLVNEQRGYKLDHKKFTEGFYTYFYKKGSATLEIPVQTLHAKVDSELLDNIRSKMISHYVTYFNSRNEHRSHYILLAAEAINNHVVFPGETFSFNSVVGKRTVEKGYLSAPVIVKGELSEGVGGGICQVSSTLFNAVDRAGVKIIERYSHSRRVPYVPPNRDATVSWYGPDFTFSNRHNMPLLIRATVLGGQLHIMIFSSEDIDFNRRKVPSAPNKLPREVYSDEMEVSFSLINVQ